MDAFQRVGYRTKGQDVLQAWDERGERLVEGLFFAICDGDCDGDGAFVIIMLLLVIESPGDCTVLGRPTTRPMNSRILHS